MDIAPAHDGKVDRVGLGLRHRFKVLQGADAGLRIADQHERRGRQHCHRCEVDFRFVGERRIGELVEHHLRHARQEERAAVGRLAEHVLRGDDAAGAGLVLDDDRRAKFLLPPLPPTCVPACRRAAAGLLRDTTRRIGLVFPASPQAQAGPVALRNQRGSQHPPPCGDFSRRILIFSRVAVAVRPLLSQLVPRPPAVANENLRTYYEEILMPSSQRRRSLGPAVAHAPSGVVPRTDRCRDADFAADRLHMTQSAVSHWLSETEELVSARLVLRGKQMRLTPAGEAVRKLALRVLGEVSWTE